MLPRILCFVRETCLRLVECFNESKGVDGGICGIGVVKKMSVGGIVECSGWVGIRWLSPFLLRWSR